MGARREIAPTERTDVTEILHDEATLDVWSASGGPRGGPRCGRSARRGTGAPAPCAMSCSCSAVITLYMYKYPESV